MLGCLPGIHHFGEPSHPGQSLRYPAQTSMIMRQSLITEHEPCDHPIGVP